MLIATTYKTNNNGTGQIVAKGNGRQRTVNYDHSQNVNQNHATAAATLAKVLDLRWHDGIECSVADKGCVFKF